MSAKETLDLDAIEARASAATPGPWKRTGVNVWAWFNDQVYTIMRGFTDRPSPVHDQNFIAHARTDVPALIAAVRERDAEITRLKAWIEANRHHPLCSVSLTPIVNEPCNCGRAALLGEPRAVDEPEIDMGSAL